MQYNRAYLAIHPEKESGADPGLTKKGLNQASSMRGVLSFLNQNCDANVGLIVVGDAKRYYQMYAELRKEKDFRDVEVMDFYIFGTDASVNDHKDRESEIIYSNNLTLPLKKSIQLDQIFTVSQMWDILRAVAKLAPDGSDVVICTGRQVMRALKEPSRSGSVYPANLRTKTIMPGLLENGIPIWTRLDILP